MFLSTNLSADDREAIAAIEGFQTYLKNCLSGIMVLGQNKQVIKKADLSKAIYSGGRPQYFKTTKLIVAQAAHDLYKYMGMRLFDLGDNKGYLLVNAHTELGQYRADASQEECDEVSAIFLTLLEIFSSPEEASSEEQIREVLAEVGFDEADVKRHFEMLLKKQYIALVKDSIATQQPDEKMYKFGSRGVAEMDPDKLMESFLDLAGSSDANEWADQQRRVERIKAAREAP